MRNVKNKIVSLLLVIVAFVSLLSFTSCNRKYDKEEVIAAAKALLKDAELLNEVYYGSGIRYYDIEIENAGYYKRADDEHLKELGFSTVNELKTLTEKTFSYSYSQNVFSTILIGLKEDGKVVSAARYYQYTNEETEESYIMVYTKHEAILKDKISYDYDSVRVERSKKENVYVKVDATVTNSQGDSQKVTITVVLIEEANGWRICNPTYANYNALNDRYNELENQKIKNNK
jgi:hypothetical protein